MSFPGLGLQQSTTRFQRFFRHWGSKANIRGVTNWVQPVAVVDRSYGPDEGALRGLTCEGIADRLNFPAIFFGALPDADGVIRTDLFVHSIKGWKFTTGPISINNFDNDIHVFTPEAPYNPTEIPNPVGLFIPGLNLDDPLSRGRAGALGGANVALTFTGLQLTWGRQFSTFTPGFPSAFGSQRSQFGTDNPMDDFMGNRFDFDPPLRIPAGNGISVQWRQSTTAPAPQQLGLRVAILYHERGLAS